MAWTREIILDTLEFTDWKETDAVGSVRFGRDYKPGTPQDNSKTIEQQALSILPTLESNYTNWATLTVAQKDTANRLAQRVSAKIIRYLLDQLDSAGP